MLETTVHGPITTQFIEVQGLRIRYAKSTQERPETALLLSPFPESVFAYAPTWTVLAEKASLVALDLPGFGRSDGREDVFPPEAMADFLVQIMNSLGVRLAHGVGPDIGTSTLLFAAAKNPRLFKSVVVGSGATNANEISGPLEELVEAKSIDAFRGLAPEAFERQVRSSHPMYAIPDAIVADYVASYAGDRFAESSRFVRDYPRALPRLATLLSKVQIPVQIISGRHDQYVPISNAEGLHRTLTRSKLDVLDSQHFIWEDAADEYGQIVAAWLGGGYQNV